MKPNTIHFNAIKNNANALKLLTKIDSICKFSVSFGRKEKEAALLNMASRLSDSTTFSLDEIQALWGIIANTIEALKNDANRNMALNGASIYDDLSDEELELYIENPWEKPAKTRKEGRD